MPGIILSKMGALSQLEALEAVLGWIYFFAWSATFWPQVLLINKRRTTAGLSTDFCAINIVGFVSYTIFTFASYLSPLAEKAYKDNTGHPPQVELNDVMFATHGAIMCTILVLQLFLLPPRIPPKWYVTIGAVTFQTLVLLGLMYAIAGKLDWYKFLQFAGMVKVLSSLVKHFPQVMLNRARASTVGWSYTMILLDVVGGGFSMAQQAVRSISMNSWAPFTSNMAKTFLAAESLAFDCYFIVQHLYLYPDRTDKDRIEKDPSTMTKKYSEEPEDEPLAP